MSHSVFTIVGPVMVGPSSSHTAGAARLGNVARALFGGKPDKVVIVLYGSFGEVYDGHSTDRALVAGLLQMDPSDERLGQSFELAKDAGIEIRMVPRPHAGKRYHPNTAKFYFSSQNRSMMVLGSSVGGGRIEIVKVDDMPVSFDGEHDIVICTVERGEDFLKDVYGFLLQSDAKVLQVFSKEKNDTETRYILEMSKAPAGFDEALLQNSAVRRVSIVPHINLWETIDVTPIQEKYLSFE